MQRHSNKNEQKEGKEMIDIDSYEKHETLDLPLREGVPGYIGVFLASWLNIQAVLKSAEFSHQPMRVYYMVEAIISQIPDEKNRKTIRDGIDTLFIELMNKYKKDNQNDNLNDKEKDHLLILASLRTLGQTTDWVVKHVGIGYKNRIGYVKKNKEERTVLPYQEDEEPEVEIKS